MFILYRKQFTSYHIHYIPLWVAFTVILFHSPLSLRCFLHHFIPIICMASSISMISFFLGVPLNLLTIGFHSHFLRCSLVIHPHHVTQTGYSFTYYRYLRFQLIHSIIHSDSSGTVSILHWTKDISQYYALKYSEMLFVWTSLCPSFTFIDHLRCR